MGPNLWRGQSVRIGPVLPLTGCESVGEVPRGLVLSISPGKCEVMDDGLAISPEPRSQLGGALFEIFFSKGYGYENIPVVEIVPPYIRPSSHLYDEEYSLYLTKKMKRRN